MNIIREVYKMKKALRKIFFNILNLKKIYNEKLIYISLGIYIISLAVIFFLHNAFVAFVIILIGYVVTFIGTLAFIDRIVRIFESL